MVKSYNNTCTGHALNIRDRDNQFHEQVMGGFKMQLDFMEKESLKGWKEDDFLKERTIDLPIEVFSEYAENSLVRRMYPTDVAFFPKADHYDMNREDRAEEYIFMYCTEGEGAVRVNEKQYMLRKNEAFCIPQFQRYCCHSDTGSSWSLFQIHFKGEDTQYFPLEDCKIVSFRSACASRQMMYLFEQLLRVLNETYTLGSFIYMSQILSVILTETYYRQKGSEAVEQNRHVKGIVRYMNQHIGENLSMECICEEAGLSKSYVNAIFFKCTQLAPIEFFTHMKMQEACRLLRTSDLYVYEIAQQLGYKDQYYFSRVFKKVVGMSPREYKNGGISRCG